MNKPLRHAKQDRHAYPGNAGMKKCPPNASPPLRLGMPIATYFSSRVTLSNKRSIAKGLRI